MSSLLDVLHGCLEWNVKLGRMSGFHWGNWSLWNVCERAWRWTKIRIAFLCLSALTKHQVCIISLTRLCYFISLEEQECLCLGRPTWPVFVFLLSSENEFSPSPWESLGGGIGQQKYLFIQQCACLMKLIALGHSKWPLALMVLKGLCQIHGGPVQQWWLAMMIKCMPVAGQGGCWVMKLRFGAPEELHQLSFCLPLLFCPWRSSAWCAWFSFLSFYPHNSPWREVR